MFYFCKYKDVLGKPNEGVHSYRLFDIAVIDVVLTIGLALFIKKYILEDYDFWGILIGCFILGIVTHRVFCVRTKIDKILF